VACRLEPKSSKALCGLAMSAQRRGQDQQAFDGYLKTLEIDPDEMTALLGLFQVSCRMGSFGQIIRYLELYLEMHPGDLSVMFSLAALYWREGRLKRTRELLERIMLLEPEHADARNLLEEIENSRVESLDRRTTCLNPMR
jgi:tetratricopeptide (TPR) repeat protein